jgi:hypothetical protein
VPIVSLPGANVFKLAFEQGAAAWAEVAAGVAAGSSSPPHAATRQASTAAEHNRTRIARNLTTLGGVRAWTTELEFAYEHGHAYLLDGTSHWSDGNRVDLRMPESAGFFQVLRIEGWGAKPALELDGYDHVAEFSLVLPSGTLALASGNCGALKCEIEPGAYRARWSARDDHYRLQLWPGSASAPRSELKRRPDLRSDLGDIPALLLDEGVQAVGSVVGTRVRGTALQLYLQLSAWASRSWLRTLRCDGVVRWQVASEPFGHALLHREHPALLPFADERGGLSFNGRPSEPERLARTRTPRATTSASRTAWPSGSRSATGASRPGR